MQYGTGIPFRLYVQHLVFYFSATGCKYNQLLQLCMVRAVWSNLVLRPVLGYVPVNLIPLCEKEEN